MKKITILLVIVCLLLSCQVTCFAAEVSQERTAGSTVITAEVPLTHTMSVKINSNKAYVTYEGAAGTEFEVPRLGEFTLTINVEDGYVISQVFLGDEDVTSALSGDQLTLEGIYESAELTVITAKATASDDSGSTRCDAASQTSDDDGSAASGSDVAQSSNDDETTSSDSTASTSNSTSSPKTGDIRTLFMWFALVVAACGGLLLTVYFGKRKAE
ncbi:MAG: hypothetical protein LUF33_05560 [Clostridiales bacterium]|nr:hypothetical protein [Clostridiales bacterium]